MKARSATIRGLSYDADSKYPATAKSNQELTNELERLQVIVGQNADLLNLFIPELRTSLRELDGRQVAGAAKTMDIDD